MKTLIAFTALLALARPVIGQETRIEVPYEQFTLPNGLTVILHRDASTPVIATNIWYHVGSAREDPGRTGFAHLFEHIMFEGSKNVPEGKIDEWFEAVGGSPNGSTTRDRTNYMQTFSSNALDLALFIESDRMGYLLDAMSPAVVDGQRDVVKNERRQSYDNRPYGLASQLLTEALYPASFPYHWPVIGYMDDLSAATYDDVVGFFQRYYTPNNASLVIAGDIDPAEARRLVEKWFGEIPRGPAVEALAPAEPKIERTERILLEDRVQLPRLYMAWLTTPAYAEDDAALIALSELLAGGKSSRLYRRLVYDLQIADDVSAYQRGGKLAGEFVIVATARAGHTLEELDREILAELERVKGEPPEAAELERIVNQYEVGFLERLQSVAAKANQLNEYFYYTGTPDYFNQDLERFRALEPAAVSAAARTYLDPARRVVLSIVPRGRPELAIPDSRAIPADDLMLSPDARGTKTAAAPGR
ncbi:MAG TPA: pitrilysin family protein [Longimicrobiales bacterium]